MLIELDSKPRLARALFIIILIAVFLGTGLICLAIRAEPIFRERAADAALQAVRECVDTVASEVFDNDGAAFLTSSEFGDGISLIEIDTARLNLLRNDFAQKLRDKLSEAHRTEIRMTLGSITGITALQGVGFTVPAKIYFGSISKVDINDEFLSAGINQTKYRAYLSVSATTAVVSAVMSDIREVLVELPVCERILVGKVPNYYISGKG